MTYRELVSDILGVTLYKDELEGCAGFRCQGEHAEIQCSCNSCKVHHIWDKEVDLGKVYANLSTSDVGKVLVRGLLNSMYGLSVHNTNDTNKLYLLSTGWCAFPRHFNFIPSSTLVEILSDGADNGFEFKVYNSTLYYREKGYANTDSTQDVD